MGRQASTQITGIPVGNTIDNGMDLGGARIYPFSTGLAITPNSMFSNYIGPANSLPVAPPVAAQAGTTGVGLNSTGAKAVANPFGSDGIILWVILGLIGAVAAMHYIHYK